MTSLVDETETMFSDTILHMASLDQVYSTEKISNSIEFILAYSENIYKREYNSKLYTERFNQYFTVESYMEFKYPYEVIKRDPEYDPKYITFDKNLLPLYLRWFNGYSWEFITSYKLTQHDVYYNYYMYSNANPDIRRLHYNDNKIRFSLLKTKENSFDNISVEEKKKSEVTKMAHFRDLTQNHTVELYNVIKDSLPMPYPVYSKYFRISSKDISKFGLKLIGKSQYIDNTYSIWTFSLPKNEDLYIFRENIERALTHLRSFYLPEVKNAGIVQVAFKFKYISEPDAFGITQEKFIYQGGRYILFTRGNQSRYMQYNDPNFILYEDTKITSYLYIKEVREYNPDTNNYSDRSDYSIYEYLSTDEFQVEVTVIKAMRGGSSKYISNSSQPIYNELLHQQTNKSTKFRILDSISWGVVKNRFDSGKNGCFIHCLKEKLKEINTLSPIFLSNNTQYTIPKLYTDLWKFIDQAIGIDSYHQISDFPFTEEYIYKTSELFRIQIIIYNLEGDVINSFLPERSDNQLNILAIPYNNSNYHYAYIQEFKESHTKKEEYKEVLLEIAIDFETINYNSAVYPYSLSYQILDNIISPEEEVTPVNIFAKDDISVISYSVIDELFTDIKSYISKKTNIIIDFSPSFKEFCLRNSLRYTNDFEYLISNFIMLNPNSLRIDEYLLPWNDKVNIIFKNKEFQKQYNIYRSQNPITYYKVRLIAYNGSKFDFNILFYGCCHLSVPIIVPPSSTGKINKFIFSLSTPNHIRVDVDCWDLNNYFRESLKSIYSSFIQKDNSIKDSVDHSIIQQLWDENNSLMKIDENSFINSLDSLKDDIIRYNNNDVTMMIEVYKKLEESIDNVIEITPEDSYQRKRNLFNDNIYLEQNKKRISDYPTISNFSYNMYEKANTIYSIVPLGKRYISRKRFQNTHKLRSLKVEYTPSQCDDESRNISIRENLVGARVQLKSGRYIPPNKIGIEVDVVSLYPYIMITQKFPIGVCKTNDNHQEIFNSHFEGFFYCEYTNIVSENQENFYLPYTENGLRIWETSKVPDWRTNKRRGYLSKPVIRDLIKYDPSSVSFVKSEEENSVIYWDDTISLEQLEEKFNLFFKTDLTIINNIETYVLCFKNIVGNETAELMVYTGKEFLLNDRLYRIFMYNPIEFNKYISEVITLPDYKKHIINFLFCYEFDYNTALEKEPIRFVDLLFHKTEVSPFKSYFEKLRLGKLNAKNKIEESLYKSLQNNLSGKMSQGPYDSETTIISNSTDISNFLIKMNMMKIDVRAKYDYINSSNEILGSDNENKINVDNRKKYKRKVIHKILTTFDTKRPKNNPFFSSSKFKKEDNTIFVRYLENLIHNIIQDKFILCYYESGNEVFMTLSDLYNVPNYNYIWSFPYSIDNTGKTLEEKLTFEAENFKKYYFTYAILDLYKICDFLGLLILKNRIFDHLTIKYLDNEQHNKIHENILDINYEVFPIKDSNDKSTCYVTYENPYKLSKYPVHISNYIFDTSRSYMWNTCLSKVNYYGTDTDSAFIPLEDLNKIKGFYSLDKLDDLILAPYKGDSITNYYGVFTGKVLFDEFIGICKKFYCLLRDGEVVKYTTKGIRDESYYIDSVYILLEVFKVIVARVKIELDTMNNSSELNKDWLYIRNYIDNPSNEVNLNDVYYKLKKLFEFNEEIQKVYGKELFKITSKYTYNSTIVTKLLPFKSNIKTVYLTLLERPLYFTSASFVSSRRKGKFSYTESLKMVQREI